jgi:hypothetical protein
MDVMILDACRAALMGEIDLDFQLVLRDGEIADRTKRPDTVAAPGAIRRSRRHCPTADRYARLCSKPRLVSIWFRYRNQTIHPARK